MIRTSARKTIEPQPQAAANSPATKQSKKPLLHLIDNRADSIAQSKRRDVLEKQSHPGQLPKSINENNHAALNRVNDVTIADKNSSDLIAAPAQRKSKRLSQPSQPGGNQAPVQRFIGYSWYAYFIGRHTKHPQVAKWAADEGNDWDHAESIYNLGVQTVAASKTELTNFIAAVGGPANFSHLSALAYAGVGKGTLPQLTNYLTEVVARAGTVQNATALLNVAPAAGTLVQARNLVNHLNGKGTLSQAIALVGAAAASAGSLQHTDDLLDDAPAGGAVAGALTTLVSNLSGKGSLVHGRNLMNAAIARGADVAETAALLAAAPAGGGTAGDLANLVPQLNNKGTVPQATLMLPISIARGASIDETRQLLAAAPNNVATTTDLATLLSNLAGKGTVPHATNLVGATAARGASIADTAALIAASPAAGGTTAALTAFVPHQNNKGTVAQAAPYITAIVAQAGTLADADNLIQAAPNGAATTNDLRTLILNLGGKGTVAQLPALVTAAAARAANVTQTNDLVAAAPTGASVPVLTAFLNANAANTAAHITALLDALTPRTLARLNTLRATLGDFHGGPNLGGNPLDSQINVGGNWARFNRWQHVAERHTYRNYDFNQTAEQQGFYAPAVMTRAQIRAVVDPLVTGLAIAQILQINAGNNVNLGTHLLGGGGANWWIATVFPTGAAHNVIFRNEINALQNLR